MPDVTNINHISLTVSDMDRSVDWYGKVLGIGELIREEHPDGSGQAIVLGKPDWSLLVGLHQHATNNKGTFSEAVTGLDHVSFGVANRAELAAWQQKFADLGVNHSPVNDKGAYAVIVFRDPDNIQLELIVMGPD